MWIASLQQVVESHRSKLWYMIDAVRCLPFMPGLICFDITLAVPCSTIVSQDLSSTVSCSCSLRLPPCAMQKTYYQCPNSQESRTGRGSVYTLQKIYTQHISFFPILFLPALLNLACLASYTCHWIYSHQPFKGSLTPVITLLSSSKGCKHTTRHQPRGWNRRSIFPR